MREMGIFGRGQTEKKKTYSGVQKSEKTLNILDSKCNVFLFSILF